MLFVIGFCLRESWRLLVCRQNDFMNPFIHLFEPFPELVLENFPDVRFHTSVVSEDRLGIYLVCATHHKPEKIKELASAGEEIERILSKKLMGRIFSLTIRTGPDFLGISRDFLGGHFYSIFVSQTPIRSFHD